MAHSLSNLTLLDYIKSWNLQIVHLEFNPLWASDAISSKTNMNYAIELALNEHKADFVSHPVRRYLSSTHSVSISHCPGMGGFLITSQRSCGLDIELKNRITPNIIQRISTSSESGPTPHAIWVVKEAAFKALSPQGSLKTVSQVRVSNWHTLKEGFWGVDAEHGSLRTKCLYFDSGNYCVGLSVVTA